MVDYLGMRGWAAYARTLDMLLIPLFAPPRIGVPANDRT